LELREGTRGVLMNNIQVLTKNHPIALFFAAISWLVGSWFTVNLLILVLVSILGAFLGFLLERISNQ
jgi:hypothetical protein